jgi:hypothetical protein
MTSEADDSLSSNNSATMGKRSLEDMMSNHGEDEPMRDSTSAVDDPMVRLFWTSDDFRSVRVFVAVRPH